MERSAVARINSPQKLWALLLDHESVGFGDVFPVFWVPGWQGFQPGLNFADILKGDIRAVGVEELFWSHAGHQVIDQYLQGHASSFEPGPTADGVVIADDQALELRRDFLRGLLAAIDGKAALEKPVARLFEVEIVSGGVILDRSL